LVTISPSQPSLIFEQGTFGIFGVKPWTTFS
jgi:hypothetical protein